VVSGEELLQLMQAVKYWILHTREDPRTDDLIRVDLSWFNQWDMILDSEGSEAIADSPLRGYVLSTLEPDVPHYAGYSDAQMHGNYVEAGGKLSFQKFLECKPKFVVRDTSH
jgi:hypothetical protein